MILVTGATGAIGKHLVRELDQAGTPFAAFVRDEAKGQALGCEFIVGDFGDPASVAAAMRGVDVLLLNGNGALPVEGEQPMIAQQKAVIDAARDAGVSHIVKISAQGAREGGKLSTGAHWEIERHLKSSGVGWSILRPNSFMQNFITGAATLIESGTVQGPFPHSRVPYVDCYDIAACAAALLTAAGPTSRTFALTGPESLTQREIADRFGIALGTPVTSVELSPEDMVAGLRSQGLPEWFARDAVALWADVAADRTLATTTGTVEELTGRAPRTFDEFLTANLAAFR
ncbi:SDR family oxidoreductase [Amycolatopsis sp. CA-230715]|uniref:SDR family oxidoreductase n=1 Tax=Amycolatopsis sp. CA-230715 TaxID=2745196 RepID=UPI001C03870D|nr:SDR family oxidoreductase [Amycolatopsis sp. CA-230715]QWF76676.1 NAD(P)H azoreductase [Amycolatopsis sp. CA-230715]